MKTKKQLDIRKNLKKFFIQILQDLKKFFYKIFKFVLHNLLQNYILYY